MVRKSTTRELLKRLDNLQSMAKMKSSEPVLICLDEWLKSNEQGTFADYIDMKLQNKADSTVIMIDDMLISIDIYLPTQLLYYLDKEQVKEFVQAADEADEKRYMEMYIQVFEEVFELNDIPDKQYFMTTPTLNCLHQSEWSDGRWLTDEEIRERFYERIVAENATKYDVLADVFSKNNYLIYKDFLEHYKTLSIEELVERYKDQRFFKMTWTGQVTQW